MNSVAMLVSFAGFRTFAVCLQLRDYATSAESREPKGAPAVAGVDQRLRVGLPGGRDIVAIDVRNPAGRTVTQIPEPEIPHPSIQFAVGKPTAVWRRGGISRIIRR